MPARGCAKGLRQRPPAIGRAAAQRPRQEPRPLSIHRPLRYQGRSTEPPSLGKPHLGKPHLAQPTFDDEEKPLDPAAERVRRKLVRFMAINLGLLFTAVIV